MQVTQPSYGAKGFFASLFDITFSSLIVGRIIRFVYVIAMIVIGLEAVGVFITALASKRSVAIIAAIILIPLGALLSLIWVRILLELVIIIFRIGEDVRRISFSPGLAVAPGVQATATAEPTWRAKEPDAAVAADPSPHPATHTSQHTAHARPQSVAATIAEPAHQDPHAAAGSEAAADLPAAGWYADPEHAGYARFWSGRAWTTQRRQISA
jgi:Domain of unknown function (DUF4282)/Protein of unknown function (DUF2510)